MAILCHKVKKKFILWTVEKGCFFKIKSDLWLRYSWTSASAMAVETKPSIINNNNNKTNTETLHIWIA